jgi:lipoprotein-anchoring transpeptidase ErfK/SrfK
VIRPGPKCSVLMLLASCSRRTSAFATVSTNNVGPSRSMGKMRLCFVIGLVLVLFAVGCSGEAPESSEPPPDDYPDSSVVAAEPSDEAPRRDAHLGRFTTGRHGVTTPEPKLAVRNRPSPSSSWHKMAMTNPIDQRLVLLIRDARSTASGEWFEVLLPERPNGSTGWVQRKDVRLVGLRHRLEIDLSDRRLIHFHNGRRVARFTVGIGQDRYPTPRGTYYVWAKVPQPSPLGPYGNYALGISGFSPVLSDWPGGGRAAVHGTAEDSDRGQKVSHGCVRVFNDDMKKLTGVPMGTPVVIKR